AKSSEDVRFAILPFILLTARDMDSDVRYAKALGVDDYLVKPVQVEDLLAVVQGKIRASRTILRALGKRSSGEQTAFKINDQTLRVDFVQHRAWCDDQELTLSQREALALERLAKAPNQIVCTMELVSITHGINTDSIEAGRLLRPLIRDLRNKIKREFGETECVQNVRGRGYMLALVS
ncbi:MAG: response regulator transcription factor, partial [Gammaproteobacteria bacterium]|nr:response regulator transcription factor [Gammaproteobacteria bacterium]